MNRVCWFYLASDRHNHWHWLNHSRRMDHVLATQQSFRQPIKHSWQEVPLSSWLIARHLKPYHQSLVLMDFEYQESTSYQSYVPWRDGCHAPSILTPPFHALICQSRRLWVAWHPGVHAGRPSHTKPTDTDYLSSRSLRSAGSKGVIFGLSWHHGRPRRPAAERAYSCTPPTSWRIQPLTWACVWIRPSR